MCILESLHESGGNTSPTTWMLSNLLFIEEGKTGLYNLVNDVDKRDDLAETEPERTRELLATLNEWIEETRQAESN
jgi:hypothetical protein